ncbi:MAG: DUF4157 domain-containing protein [Ardenticatenaceae bacterium]|nr:DUF4157 domain-containing protein [Ardenticatenaceae bacterium]
MSVEPKQQNKIQTPKSPPQPVQKPTPETIQQQEPLEALLQRAQLDPGSLSHSESARIQRSIGNQALGQLIVQRKMAVGPVNDKYEQEADTVAQHVVSNLHASPTQTSSSETAQRQEEEELQMKPLLQRQEEEELQTKLLQRQEISAQGYVSTDLESDINQARGGGQRLDTDLQQSMGQAMGADFSDVKIHTDARSHQLNQSIQAKAFTTGQDVFFRQGEYNPKSKDGQALIAHELTHVVQQNGSAVQKVQRAKGDAQGLTGGKVTLGDFAGGEVSNVDKTKANYYESINQSSTLPDMEKHVKTGTARTEKEMLAAIAANTLPRYIARVGPKENFTKFNSFGRPSEFIFATEPADLAGLSPIAAMVKVGWTKEWIKGAAQKPIVVCILDTHKVVPTSNPNKKEKVSLGKMEWPELKAKALADPQFDVARQAVNITDPGACFDIWARTPVGGDPQTPDAQLKEDCKKLRKILNDLYGANELYSGMGATISESGTLGAREVMVSNNDTGFKLTPDNHVLVDTSPSQFTTAEADAL